MLKEIRRRPGINPGGTVKLYLIDHKGVKNIPAAIKGTVTANLELNYNYAFKSWDFMPGKCKLGNPSAGEQGSSYFETVIELTIPRDDDEMLDSFSKMINGLFIAVLDQASRSVKIAGTVKVPLICKKVDIDSGAELSDLNGTVFQFKARTGPAPGYTGSIQTIPIPPPRPTAWRVKASTMYCVKSD